MIEEHTYQTEGDEQSFSSSALAFFMTFGNAFWDRTFKLHRHLSSSSSSLMCSRIWMPSGSCPVSYIHSPSSPVASKGKVLLLCTLCISGWDAALTTAFCMVTQGRHYEWMVLINLTT